MKKMMIIEEVRRAVAEGYGVAPEMALSLSVPPNPSLGDFSVDCFALAKQLKKSPALIAQEVARLVRVDGAIASVEAVGPYINVWLSNGAFFEEACIGDFDQLPKTGKRVMVEYLSPNTNKPLHLGHVRNGVLGMAVSNILEWVGNTVIKANLVNDRGVHICKSMLAWKKFANGATPESTGKKGDHFVGDYYVIFAQKAKEDPSLEDEAQALLLKWESGDLETIQLWKTMNEWVYAGFAETYAKLSFGFDTFYHESTLYMSGKDIVQTGLEKGVFVKDEKGAVVYMLPEHTFGKSKDGIPKKKVLLRSDGTSVYTTQDLGVALKKAEDYGLDASIYVVANEQDDHFKALFDILRALGYVWAKQLYHLSYGMVELPNGRMKSREGTVVDADDLVADVVALAAMEVRAKNAELPEEEVMRRAEVIGLGAIKFYLVKANPKQRIKFDPQESIAFDGVTGAYCQYAYARACGLLGKRVISDKVNYALLGSNLEERVLAQKLLLFKDKILLAAEEYNPSLLASAVYELAKAFNQWYNKYQILDESNAELSTSRLTLARATSVAIKMGLNMLGIEVLERM